MQRFLPFPPSPGSPRFVSRSLLSRAAVSTGLALVLTALTTAPGGAVSAPQQILAGPEDQTNPSVNDTHLIWSQNSVANSNRYHAYGRILGTTEAFRLNPTGTRGFAGGVDPDQDRAIYQQIEGPSSDLYAINLATRQRTRLPAPINSARWEWGPRISNAFYLFARDTAAGTTLFLYDRGTKMLEALVSRDFTHYTSPAAVGERYATWSVCGPLICNAFVHDTQTGQTRRIRTPDGKSRYAPVVLEAEGLVYFVRSGDSCGADVRIMRLPVATLGATPTNLVTLPGGVDVDFQMSLVQVGAQVDLWFSRYRCAAAQGDLYRIRDVGLL